MPDYYDEEEEVITIPAPAGGVKRGEFAIVGKLGGVAVHAADEGEEVEIELKVPSISQRRAALSRLALPFIGTRARRKRQRQRKAAPG